MAFEQYLMTGKAIELDRETKTMRFHLVSADDEGDKVVLSFQYDTEEPIEGEPVAGIESPQEDSVVTEPEQPGSELVPLQEVATEPEPTPPDEPGELVEGDNTE